MGMGSHRTHVPKLSAGKCSGVQSSCGATLGRTIRKLRPTRTAVPSTDVCVPSGMLTGFAVTFLGCMAKLKVELNETAVISWSDHVQCILNLLRRTVQAHVSTSK